MTSDTLDTSRSHPARRYNYWLGGKDNFAADRASADRIAEKYPQVVSDARENRKWMHRVVRHLDKGVHQFIDIGVGIPVPPNMHEVAQATDPRARVVYVDNDPLVMCHARALLTSAPQGRTEYAQLDVRQPGTILGAAQKVLDFDQPIAVLMVALLHFLPDDAQANDIVHQLMDGLPAKSLLALTHFTADGMTTQAQADITHLAHQHGPFCARTRDQLERLLSGLTLLEPGITRITQWRPDEATGAYGDANVYAALAQNTGGSR